MNLERPSPPPPSASSSPARAIRAALAATPPGTPVFFDFPSTDVTTIPDAKAFVAAVKATGMKPVPMNQAITRGYGQLARVFQATLDPGFTSSAAPPASGCRVNWFAFAPHASHEAGEGIIVAEMARLVLDTLEGDSNAQTLEALARAGLEEDAQRVASMLTHALRATGLPGNAALALGTLATSGNFQVYEDPRTLMATAIRLAELLWQAPEQDPARKTEVLAVTLETTLASGNLSIFEDIAGTAQEYLTFRKAAGAPRAEDVLGQFLPAGASAADARRVFELALQGADRRPMPTDFDRLFPGMNGQSMVVAAYALFEESRAAADPGRKDRLIAFANNLLAYREQHDSVQPVFTPPALQPGEVSRAALMRALTPPLILPLGNVTWRFSDYAARRPDRDGSVFTSRVTEYNWALFVERWPAILDAFVVGYGAQAGLWRFPKAGGAAGTT